MSLSAAVSSQRCTLQPLEWDTQFFRARMGEVRADDAGEILPTDLKRLIATAADEGYQHLVLRCDGNDWQRVWAAEAAGMRLVDVGVDLRSELAEPVGPSDGTRLWEPADLPGLQAIAAEAFVYSRFAVDPFFTAEQVAEFHRTWIGNLCHGRADVVFVSGLPGEPEGFVSCSLSGSVGRIPLIAVLQERRGRGIADELMRRASAWFQSVGASSAWVKTQAQNTRAIRLYSRHGYALGRTEFVFSVSPVARA